MSARIGTGGEGWRGAARSLAAAAVGVLAMGAGLCGCAGGGQEQRAESMRLDVPPEVVALAVDVSNFNGSVVIRADRGEPGAVVIESRRFVSGVGDRGASRAAMDAIDVVAEVEADGPLGVVRVSSAAGGDSEDGGGDGEPAGGAEASGGVARGVDLVIRVPRADGVRILNAGGPVRVTDAGGTVEIINDGGSVEFRTSRTITEPLTLVTHEGEVYCQIPTGSSGAFDMLTLEGQTTVKDRGAAIGQTYTGRGELRFVLNDGQNPIVLRSNRGNVRAWIMDDPLSLSRAVPRDAPDMRDRLYLQGTRRHTRELPSDTPRTGVPDNRISAP